MGFEKCVWEREAEITEEKQEGVVSLQRGFSRVIFDTRRRDAAIGEERNCRRLGEDDASLSTASLFMRTSRCDNTPGLVPSRPITRTPKQERESKPQKLHSAGI
ncbi:hypothetical protein E2C01_081659 [Portunus trituberculatus]|uniref:Uncharacterized protein n=1 Tax=Portunus trituberculatus TaxID=210409 RepID=A0A5B7IX44_PORTR|nr:hypothetical protein [Portunus trituberculatus]